MKDVLEDLDLDQIEADLADVPAELFGVRTSGDGPMRRLIASVPALVAEVRRLRGWLDTYRSDLGRARDERNAARAEAERLEAGRDSFARMYARAVERYDDLGMGVMQKIADRCSLTDVLNFVGDQLNECDHADDESIALWKRAAGVAAEAARVREALQAIRELHRPSSPDVREPHCVCCGPQWPCATVRALDAALDGEQS